MVLSPSPDLRWPSCAKDSLVFWSEAPAVNSPVTCRPDCTVTRSTVLVVRETWFRILALLLIGFVIMDKLFSIAELQIPVVSLGMRTKRYRVIISSNCVYVKLVGC